MSSWNFVFQNGWYIGNNFNALLYGVELVLYFQTVQTIMDGRRRREGHKFTHSDKTFLCLCTFFLCMITIYVVTQNFFGEEMWIINEGYPGGSGQYFDDHATVWYQVFGSTSWISLSLASDAFLIYRTFIVWSGLRHVIIVPCILYVGSLVMGIFTLIYSSKPGLQIIFSEASSHIALAYSSIGLALNITCTALICARILCVSHKLRRALGPSRLLSRALGADDAAAAGIGATAVIVESMLPYTCFGVAYVVTLGAGSPLSILFLSLYAMFNCLSPQMIILRVIAERGWRPERASDITVIQFRRSSYYGARTAPTRTRFSAADIELGEPAAAAAAAAVDLRRLSHRFCEPDAGQLESGVRIYDVSVSSAKLDGDGPERDPPKPRSFEEV